VFSADDNSVVDGTRKITISGTMKEVMWAFNAVKGLILVCKLDNVLCGAWLLWLHNTHSYYGYTWLLWLLWLLWCMVSKCSLISSNFTYMNSIKFLVYSFDSQEFH